MFVADGLGFGEGWDGDQAPLQTREAVLIWAMRRLARAMVEAGPLARCGVVEAALIREFGARGQEIGVLLRCVVQGLRIGARRPLLLCGGTGCMGSSPADMEMLSDDEQALLTALRTPCAANLEPILEIEQAAMVGQMLTMMTGLMRGT